MFDPSFISLTSGSANWVTLVSPAWVLLTLLALGVGCSAGGKTDPQSADSTKMEGHEEQATAEAAQDTERDDCPTGPAPSSGAIIIGGDGGARIITGQVGTTRPTTPEDLARVQRLRAAQSQPAPPPNPNRDSRSSTERAIDDARSRPPGELMELGVGLDDPPFDFTRLHRGPEGCADRAIAERRRQLKPSQDAVAKRIEAIGGKVLGRSWLVNVVDTRVPAGRVEEIARWPGVRSLSLNEPVVSE